MTTLSDAHTFPAGFLWGAATSAYQIEGGADADGRGPSIWDTWSAAPGNVRCDATGAVTADHYHRWRADIALMRWLGLTGYRFSTSWSRVMPDGVRVNARGLDFYDRLVDGLLEAGVTPYLTLNHWDLPQPLQDAGGWPARATIAPFVRYAEVVARRLGDRVRHWTTHNEPWVLGFLGYYFGQHAPGVRDESGRLALQAAHHLLVSHGLAAPVIRAHSPGARVGIVNVHFPNRPASAAEADVAAAARADLLDTRWFLDPLVGRGYPAEALDWYGARAPIVEPGDMAVIAAPLDFLGVNYYYRRVIAADEAEPLFGYRELPHPSSAATTMSWSELDPPALGEHLLRLTRDYPGPDLYVTENGLPLPEQPGPDGYVDDTARVDYLAAHLAAAGQAVAGGAPLKGYFAWCLLDTFEWNYGYGPKFGLVRVDFETLARVPKRSAGWYRDWIRTHS